MVKFPGLGERIAERMKRTGYWNERTDRPDVRRFCMERRGYLSQSVYEWLNKGATPEYESLVRLARDLFPEGTPVEAAMAWLLLRPAALLSANGESAVVVPAARRQDRASAAARRAKRR